MTNTEILALVSRNRSIGYNKIMSLLTLDELNSTRSRIKYLLSEHHLKGEAKPGGSLSITDKGRLYLELLIEEENERLLREKKEAEAEAQRKAEQKKQNRHDWCITVIGGALQTLIGTVGGALITLLIQRFT